MPYRIVKQVVLGESQNNFYRNEYSNSLGVNLEEDSVWRYFFVKVYGPKYQVHGKIIGLLNEKGELIRKVDEDYLFDVGIYQYYGVSTLQQLRFLFLPKEFVQSYAISEGTIIYLSLLEVIKEGVTEAIFSKCDRDEPMDVKPNFDDKLPPTEVGKLELIATCRNCGQPQGIYNSNKDLRLSIANNNKCSKCGATFGFWNDGSISDLNIEEVNNTTELQESVYNKGDAYEFYRRIKKIIDQSKTEVFLISSWVDEEALNLYLDNIPTNVKIRILTNKTQRNFLTVARKFKGKPNVNFEVKVNADCHDRLLFVDSDCWVMGQSIQDAGRKPTYLIKTESCDAFRRTFESMWNTSTIIV